jgi:hypothetical protein
MVRHNNPLAFDEHAIFIIFDVPFTLVERVTVSFGTAISAKVVLQRLKPRLQWIARPLAGWIADQNNGGSDYKSNLHSSSPLSPHLNHRTAIGVFDRRQKRSIRQGKAQR